MNLVTAALIAFALGLLLGLSLDDLYDALYRRARPADRKQTEPMADATPRRSPLLLWLLIASLAANAFVGALLIKTRIDTGRLTECVAEYNQQFSQSYQARTQSAPETQAALDRVLIAVSKKDAATFRDALSDYVTLRAKVKRDQVANPPPPLPEQFCGKETRR
jgi:anti-sigma factor RsiW